jgi:hypothetical protein
VPAKRGGNGWLLASRIGSNALYTTVQVRDGGSPTSAVHGLPQARLCGRGGSLRTYARNTPIATLIGAGQRPDTAYMRKLWCV